jgi:hypothetical protein
MLELKFPRLITAPNSRSVLRLCNRAIRRRDPQVTFDLSRTEFVTPSRRLIRLSVADFGLGILNSLKKVKRYSMIGTSHEAITLAVEEGVSSRRGKAGLGLSHIRRFARVNQGTMTVISANGKVNFYSKSIEKRPMPSNFNGTVIELRINADKEGFYFLSSEKEYLF